MRSFKALTYFNAFIVIILTISIIFYNLDYSLYNLPYIFYQIKFYDIVNIAYCTTNNQLHFAAISSLSIINRTKKKIDFYIFTPDPFTKPNTIFEKIENETNRRVTFYFDTINFTLCKETFRNRWNFWNPFAYARIFMIDKIPVSRCIYVDTDVYGCGDVNDLWQIHLGHNLIAAVPDRLPSSNFVGSVHMQILNTLVDPKEIEIMNKTGLTVNNYFNSGVLLMNIDEMRKMNFVNKCVAAYKKNQTFYPDQDMLNVVCGHRRIILDWRFNKPVVGDWTRCVFRHYNHLKVTKPAFIRHQFDYDYYYDSLDEYNRLLGKLNHSL